MNAYTAHPLLRCAVFCFNYYAKKQYFFEKQPYTKGNQLHYACFLLSQDGRGIIATGYMEDGETDAERTENVSKEKNLKNSYAELL